jgi:hypothetical protein
VVETAAHGGGDMTQINEGNYADEALLAMKSRPPNADGTIGVTIKPDMPEWNAWQAYFLGKRMDNRASFMRSRGKAGYMVPCRNPGDFDYEVGAARQEYALRVHRGEVPKPDTSRHSREIPFSERDAMAAAARLAEVLKPDLRRRVARNDARDFVPPAAPVEPRPLSPSEVASMKRMLRIPETDEDA